MSIDIKTRAVIERLVEASIDSAFKLSATEEESAKLESAIADARKLLECDALAQPADEDAWLNDAIKYAKNYGGHCRDCADNDGICPQTKLPCGEKDEAIRRVLTAILYGEKHGYLRNRPAKDGFVSVPVEPFVVRHYIADERPSIKGNGFDGLYIGEDREEAEQFVKFINAAMIEAAKGGGK